MADILDDADRAIEMFNKEALSKRKPEGPIPIGHCYNCGAEFTSAHDGRRWCDAECRNDWAKRTAKA